MSEEIDEREAEQKLEEAIEKYIDTLQQREGLLVDWVLITSEHGLEEGRSVSYNGIFGPYRQLSHNAAGLLRFGTIALDRKIEREMK